jgi:hypothetical protein
MPSVHLELVDAATGETLQAGVLPAERLPETFAVETTLHLGDEEWRVEGADPETRAAAVERGALRLALRRVQRVDPREILYSLPTLEDALPPVVAGAPFLELHEDEWRQVELVAARFEPEIAAELADIRAVVDSAGPGRGYRALHVRRRIPRPLGDVTIAVEALGAILGAPPRATVGFRGQTVAGGFAFGGVYGREEGGVAQVIALAPGVDPVALRGLARDHDLLLVDWVAVSSRRP